MNSNTPTLSSELRNQIKQLENNLNEVYQTTKAMSKEQQEARKLTNEFRAETGLAVRRVAAKYMQDNKTIRTVVPVLSTTIDMMYQYKFWQEAPSIYEEDDGSTGIYISVDKLEFTPTEINEIWWDIPHKCSRLFHYRVGTNIDAVEAVYSLCTRIYLITKLKTTKKAIPELEKIGMDIISNILDLDKFLGCESLFRGEFDEIGRTTSPPEEYQMQLLIKIYELLDEYLELGDHFMGYKRDMVA